MNNPIKILSTKTIARDLIQQAQVSNIWIDEADFIKTKPVDDIALAEKIKAYSHKKIVAFFTSVNAVECVFSIADAKSGWKIFCTSGATKEALLHYINEDAIVDTAHNASALADKFLENKTADPCVFFCGSRRLNTLPDKILKQGINLEEVIVYETIASPEKINEKYNGILFFSPSAVESFFLVNKIEDQTVLFSVGKTTTKAIRKFTKNTIVTAVFPGAESVLKEVRNFDFNT